MIQLVKTDRKLNLSGVTPAFVAVVTLFVFTVLAGHFFARHYQIDASPCLFKLVTREPCFLCGGTRASVSLASGQPVIAFRFNPLVTILLCFTGIVLLLKFLFARKLRLSGAIANRQFLWWAVILLVLANWIYIVKTSG